MNSKYVQLFLDNKDNRVQPTRIEAAEAFTRALLKDEDYVHFISKIGNGGSFFSDALLLYSFDDKYDYLNAQLVNAILEGEYADYFKGYYAFGQDLFGNQFVFHQQTRQVFFFKCETGRKELLAEGFNEWLAIFESDKDYFSGEPLAAEWKEKKALGEGFRLCPRLPFIMGGEYEINNLIPSPFPKYIQYYAELAKQIANVEDGVKVKLTLPDPQ